MAWRLNLDLHAASRFITFVSANLILRHSCLLQFVRRQALVAINAVNSGPLWYPIFYIMNSENRPYRDAAEAALRKQINLSQKQRKMGFSALLVVIPNVYQNRDCETANWQSTAFPKTSSTCCYQTAFCANRRKGMR